MEAFPSLNKNSNFYSLTIKISIMKTTKVFLFLAFLFCISFSKNAEAAASQSNQISMTTIVKDKQQLSTKSLKKSIKRKFKKVKKIPENISLFVGSFVIISSFCLHEKKKIKGNINMYIYFNCIATKRLLF